MRLKNNASAQQASRYNIAKLWGYHTIFSSSAKSDIYERIVYLRVFVIIVIDRVWSGKVHRKIYNLAQQLLKRQVIFYALRYSQSCWHHLKQEKTMKKNLSVILLILIACSCATTKNTSKSSTEYSKALSDYSKLSKEELDSQIE